jgi:hypothetical protein
MSDRILGKNVSLREYAKSFPREDIRRESYERAADELEELIRCDIRSKYIELIDKYAALSDKYMALAEKYLAVAKVLP